MENLDIQTDCWQYAHVEDSAGQTQQRDLFTKRGSELFKISVGTPDQIKWLNAYNKQLPEDLKLDSRIVSMEDISTFEGVKTRLAQMPFSDLKPFLKSAEELKIKPDDL